MVVFPKDQGSGFGTDAFGCDDEVCGVSFPRGGDNPCVGRGFKVFCHCHPQPDGDPEGEGMGVD